LDGQDLAQGDKAPVPPEQQLEVLAADYEATREDQRQSLIREVALISAGIAVFAAYYYLIADKQAFLIERPLLAAALPLAPYLIAGAFVFYSIDSTLRGYYIRALERAIHERLTIRSGLGNGVQLPSYGHLTFIVGSTRYSSAPVWILGSLAFLAVLALYGGSSLVVLSILPTVVDRIAAGLFYGTLAGVLVWIFVRTTLQPRAFFLQALSSYSIAVKEPLDRLLPRTILSVRRSRGLKYLMLPRVADLIKWTIFLLAWTTATTTYTILRDYDSTIVWQSAARAALFLLVFEFLVYQARYQWNDLRGAAQDREHVAVDDRRRLPENFERHSLAVLVLRLLLAAYLVHLVFRQDTLAGPASLLAPAYAVAGLPLLFAIPYEIARSRSDRSDHTDRLHLVHLAIFVLVGLGYGLRAALGVYIGASFEIDLIMLLVLFVAVTFAGGSDVVMGWVLEAHVTGDTGRPHVRVLKRYAEKLKKRDLGRPEPTEPYQKLGPPPASLQVTHTVARVSDKAHTSDRSSFQSARWDRTSQQVREKGPTLSEVRPRALAMVHDESGCNGICCRIRTTILGLLATIG